MIDKAKIPELSAEIFVIPLKDSRYLVYAPLRKAAFVGNSQIVNFLADLKDDVYHAETDADGAIVDFLRRLEMVDAGEEVKPISSRKGRPKPVSLALFPTTDCNLRCTYCYASAGDILVIPMSNVEKITTERGEVAEPEQPLQITPSQNDTQATMQKPHQNENKSNFVGGCRMYMLLGVNNISIFDYSAYSGGKLEFGYFINPKNLLSLEIGGGSDEFEDFSYLYFFSWSYIVRLSEKFQWRIGPSIGILDLDETYDTFAIGGNTGIIWNFSKNRRWFLDLGGRLFGTPYEAGSQFNLSVGWRFSKTND